MTIEFPPSVDSIIFAGYIHSVGIKIGCAVLLIKLGEFCERNFNFYRQINKSIFRKRPD